MTETVIWLLRRPRLGWCGTGFLLKIILFQLSVHIRSRTMLYLLTLLLLVALIAQLVPGTALADMVPRYNDDTWVTHGTQNLAIASFIVSLMLGAGAAAYVWRAKQPLSRVSAIIGFGLILAAAGFFVLFVLFQFSAFSMAAQDKRKAEDHERALREWREARPDSGK